MTKALLFIGNSTLSSNEILDGIVQSYYWRNTQYSSGGLFNHCHHHHILVYRTHQFHVTVTAGISEALWGVLLMLDLEEVSWRFRGEAPCFADEEISVPPMHKFSIERKLSSVHCGLHASSRRWAPPFETYTLKVSQHNSNIKWKTNLLQKSRHKNY